MRKNKKNSSPIWGVVIAPVSKLSDDGEKNIPISIDEWAKLSAQERLPSRQIRGRCNTTGEPVNIGVVEELPKVIRKTVTPPPPGPRIKKKGKGGGGKPEEIATQKSYPYYPGKEEGDLCRYSPKGVFELNYNDPWVKSYFFKGDAVPSKKDKDLRVKLFASLLIRAKTIASTYRNYENAGEITGQKIDESDFINRSLIIQVKEDPLILELCEKMDD